MCTPPPSDRSIYSLPPCHPPPPPPRDILDNFRAKEIENTSQEKLKQNLLIPTTHYLRVNFDPELVCLLREVKYFTLLRIEVPAGAMQIYKSNEVFRQQTGNLDLIVNIYNKMLETLLDEERPLLASKLEPTKALLKGLKLLNWKSSNITEFIDQTKQEVKEAPSILLKIKQNVIDIKALLKKWAEFVLMDRKPSKTYSVEEFNQGNDPLVQKRYTEIEGDNEALADYLETMRIAYPRFYFVSSADLIDILSKGSNPHSIMKLMPKCFDNVATFEFTVDKDGNKTKEAIGMYSKEQEYVPFHQPFKMEGAVENYLREITHHTHLVIVRVMADAVSVAEDKPRHEFMYDWPAQITCSALRIIYTEEVNIAFEQLEEGNENSLKEYNKKQVEQLTKCADLILTDMTPNNRLLTISVVTVDVHSRDVIAALIETKAENSQNFMWQSQLKFSMDQKTQRLQMNICDYQNYGNEYIGNAGCLVITPLTDRCYITLTQAMRLILGGAPAGPAGTGKTETVKDLGRASGIIVYVFNCSDQMDYKSMGQVFKGLSMSGAWGCFDEFNRINLEVLSVVSSQWKTLLDAIRVRRPPFVFEDEEISLSIDPLCCAFITMNPGYGGRVQLPTSMKVLFRPCAMVVPDMDLIAEIMLMSEGFVDGKVLAKFMILYRLSQDLLSQAKHYDWKLRAIKTTLNVARAMRRADIQMTEDKVLLRALHDFNLGKLVSDDVGIFTGLLNKLFPKTMLVPRKVDKKFEELIVTATKELQLQPEEIFVLKVTQLQEILGVRWSIFVIGLAGSGKSELIKTLQRANILHGQKHTMNFLNPKSVTRNGLYGDINPATREWKDGLIGQIFRDLANCTTVPQEHIVFDSDVDPEWIESMNTVMDDNKMLTLASNERIPLTKPMRLVLEVENLREASPATVSRNGIIFVYDTDIGWRPFVASWIQNREIESEKQQLIKMFDIYLPKTMDWMRKNVKTIAPLPQINLAQTVCFILDGLLGSGEKMASTQKSMAPEDAATLFESVFVYACIWGLGGALSSDKSNDYRTMFDKFWRDEHKTIKLPEGGLVYDCCVDLDTGAYTPWSSQVPTYNHSPDIPFGNISVSTVDTVRLTYFLTLLMDLKRRVMFVGGSGTGKTTIVKDKLRSLDPDQYLFLSMNLNCYTDSLSLQTSMESMVEKKTGKLFGPPGSKKLIYFIDDLNMPQVDKYGTQQLIALLREHMDYGEWYERAKLTLKQIQGVQYISCLNPSAGSFVIDPRCQRQYCTFSVLAPSIDQVTVIFSSILGGHLSVFNPDISANTAKIVKAAVDLHRTVCDVFVPTAIKFHYILNLRELSAVFEGLCRSREQFYSNTLSVVRLFLHEAERVYQDRMITDADRTRYWDIVADIVKKNFDNLPKDQVEAQPLIFTSFTTQTSDDSRPYMPAPEFSKLRKVVEDMLAQYNETNAVMDLVLFEQAIEHVCRVVRVIDKPRGNALCVGVGGSGKTSLAKLSAFICGYESYQVTVTANYNVNAFKENLAELYIKTSVKNIATCFIFNDGQIIDERFLVYMNDLLASGNISDLLAKEQKDDCMNAVRNEAKQAGVMDTPELLWDFFIEKSRKMWHTVLCFSPVGDKFRVRARQFPALTSCTVIDWFHPWPQDALMAVANRFVADIPDLDDKVKESLAQHMAFVHTSVGDASIAFLDADRRYNYTTPMSFLDLIDLYKNMLEKKRKGFLQLKDLFENGLEKMRSAADQVAMLQENLKVEVCVAIVEDNQKATDALNVNVGRETAVAEVQQQAAVEEEAKVAVLAAECLVIQKECEEDLKAAEPVIQAALAALDSLDKKSLGEMKSLATPPPEVGDVAAAVMILTAPKGVIPKESCDDNKSFFNNNRKDLLVKPAGRTTVKEHKLIFAIQLCMRILSQKVQLGSALFELSDPDRKCIMFDPVVDSWIESMNTVLDDNKKLCLVLLVGIELNPGPKSAPDASAHTQRLEKRKSTLPVEDLRSVVAVILGGLQLIDDLITTSADKFEVLKEFSIETKQTMPVVLKSIDTHEKALDFMKDCMDFETVFDGIGADQVSSQLQDFQSKDATALMSELRSKCGNWESNILWNTRDKGGDCSSASGMIDPILFLNFLHDHEDVKSVLDVGVGAGVQLAVAFAYFSLKTTSNAEFTTLGSEKLALKFIKCNFLLKAISKVIAEMRKNQFLNWTDHENTVVQVKVKMTERLCVVDDIGMRNFIFESNIPDAVLFNNHRITDAELHKDIMHLFPRFLLVINPDHFDWANNLLKYTLAAFYYHCANFQGAHLVQLQKFDIHLNETIFTEGIRLINDALDRLPPGTEVQFEIQRSFSNIQNNTPDKQELFVDIICAEFANIFAGKSISEFDCHCPSVLMSVIAYFVMKFIAKSQDVKFQAEPTCSWLHKQSDEDFRTYSRVHSKCFSGSIPRLRVDASFLRTDKKWLADTADNVQRDIVKMPQKWKLGLKSTNEYGHWFLQNAKTAEHEDSASVSSITTTSSAGVSSNSSFGFCQSKKVKLSDDHDDFLLFLQPGGNILEVKGPSNKQFVKDFADMKTMILKIYDSTSKRIVNEFATAKVCQVNPPPAVAAAASVQKMKQQLQQQIISGTKEPGVTGKQHEQHNSSTAGIASESSESVQGHSSSSDDSALQYVHDNYSEKQAWNKHHFSNKVNLLTGWKIQRDILKNMDDDTLLDSQLLENVYGAKMQHTVGKQFYAIMLCRPYSGHNKTFLTKNGIKFIKKLGILDKYHGVNMSEWGPQIQGKVWKFFSIQFGNAMFVGLSFIDNEETHNDKQEYLCPDELLDEEPEVIINLHEDLRAQNFVVSPALENLLVLNCSSWTLTKVKTFPYKPETFDKLIKLGVCFVKTMTQIIAFGLSCNKSGSHNVDLSRTAIRMEDCIVKLLFDSATDDMKVNVQMHYKLFHSSAPRKISKKKRRACYASGESIDPESSDVNEYDEGIYKNQNADEECSDPIDASTSADNIYRMICERTWSNIKAVVTKTLKKDAMLTSGVLQLVRDDMCATLSFSKRLAAAKVAANFISISEKGKNDIKLSNAFVQLLDDLIKDHFSQISECMSITAIICDICRENIGFFSNQSSKLCELLFSVASNFVEKDTQQTACSALVSVVENCRTLFPDALVKEFGALILHRMFLTNQSQTVVDCKVCGADHCDNIEEIFGSEFVFYGRCNTRFTVALHFSTVFTEVQFTLHSYFVLKSNNWAQYIFCNALCQMADSSTDEVLKRNPQLIASVLSLCQDETKHQWVRCAAMSAFCVLISQNPSSTSVNYNPYMLQILDHLKGLLKDLTQAEICAHYQSVGCVAIDTISRIAKVFGAELFQPKLFEVMQLIAKFKDHFKIVASRVINSGVNRLADIYQDSNQANFFLLKCIALSLLEHQVRMDAIFLITFSFVQIECSLLNLVLYQDQACVSILTSLKTYAKSDTTKCVTIQLVCFTQNLFYGRYEPFSDESIGTLKNFGALFCSLSLKNAVFSCAKISHSLKTLKLDDKGSFWTNVETHLNQKLSKKGNSDVRSKFHGN